MSYDDRLNDYVDVAARMRMFFEKHPEGCLRPAETWRIEQVGDRAFVVYAATAYRTPDDPKPGIGVAWEPFPGRTPYTKDSELMNAETSAWGRAILAVGAADTRRGIATAEEVRNRQADAEADAEPPKPVDEHQLKIVHTLWSELGFGGDANRATRLDVMGKIVGRPLDSSKDLTATEASRVINELRRKAAELPSKEAKP